MKKTVACVLIFTTLSSVGSMCFAKETTTANSVHVDYLDVEVAEGLPQVTLQESKEDIEKEKLVNDLNDIANDDSLDVQSALLKVWACIKSFVKKNCTFIVTLTCAIIIPVLCHYFGKDIVKLVIDTIEKIKKDIDKERKSQAVK